jgi:hypothetical protein
MAGANEMRMEFLPIVALAFGLAITTATIPTAVAKSGGGGMGGGAAMGGGHAGGMPATSNAGGQVTGPARAAEVSSDQGNGNSANTGNSSNNARSATAPTTTSSTTTSFKTSNGRLAAALGALNASHASATARAHASSRSRVGKIAAYDKAMLTALAMPDATPTEVAARNAAIASARETLLAAASNKPLTARVVAVVDHRLGLPPSDPRLGLTP